jgi:asparagine synthase (glutamine-hydrolysing)
MDRPKMGFAIPVQDWLSQELRSLLLDHINKQSLSRHNLFNINETLKIVDGYLRGCKESYLQVWHLLMFQMWYDRWTHAD